mgnify:CR=1 FL=1
MLNARIFAVAASLVFGAAAAQASSIFEGEASQAPAVATTSTLSRAEVQAQTEQAMRNGTMAMVGDSVNAREAQGTSTLSREAVRQQAAQFAQSGHSFEGESYGE